MRVVREQKLGLVEQDGSAQLTERARFVYYFYFVVMPIGGVLLFPLAFAANRWLTPLVSSWLRRS